MTDKFQVFDALDDATYDALRDSIKAEGVLVPIIVDQDGDVLDGNHRRAICSELNISCPSVAVRVRDDEHGRDLARQLNAVRRHLTSDQKTRVIALLREKGHSLRAIAKVTDTP